MANNKIQVKRTTTAGRTPNTTNAGNTQYIAAGELALNMTDQIMFTSDGTNLIYVGANQVNQNISNTLTVKAISANGSNGSAGQVLATNGTATYWTTAGGSGTVTSVGSGNGLTGGPITTTGTLSVLANSGIVANATGVYVNTAYIATLDANNAGYLGGIAAAAYVQNTFTGTLSGNIAFTGNNSFSQQINVGANVWVSTQSFKTGNITVNAYMNSSLVTVQSGSSSANVTSSGFTVGNSVITSTSISIENTIAIGNTVVNSTAMSVGNSTTSSSANSTAFRINNTTISSTNAVFGGTIAANGGIGTAGQALISGGSANAYWGIPYNANNASYLGGTLASGYQTTAGLSANVATLTANNAGYLGGVIAASYVQNTDSRTLSGNLNFTGTNVYFTSGWFTGANVVANTTAIAVGNSTVKATMTSGLFTIANSTGYFETTPTYTGGWSGSYTGLLTPTYLTMIGPSNTATVNSTAITIGVTSITPTSFTLGGQFNANGAAGAAGQVLTSGAAGNVYWADAGGGGSTYMKGGSATVGSLAVEGQNIFRVNANVVSFDVTFVAGENASATGPLTVAAGKTITVEAGARVSIV